MSPSSGTLFYNILLFHHWVLLTKIRKILPSYPVDKINNLNKIFSLFLVVRNISGSSILPSHGKCTVHYWNYSWDTPRINPLVLIEIVNFSWRCKKRKGKRKKKGGNFLKDSNWSILFYSSIQKIMKSDECFT